VILRSAQSETKENKVAAGDIVPVPGTQFEETLTSASPDLLREMIRGFAQRMMDAEVEQVCGAGYGEVTPDRVNSRNGYRRREWDTRAGTIELAVPKLRQGTYYPEWLLERRRRAERALATVVATSYLLGVSTRRVEKLAESLGVTKLSKSQVSVMAAELDEMVASFRSRPLDAGPYAFVWIDALTQKVREGGRTVNVHALIATGVNADGKREILGLDVATAEDGAGWLAFLRGLAARGLAGVQLVTSDCHHGLRDAIASVLPGAARQRCRAHYSRNLATRVPKSAQPWVSTLVRTIFEQPDAASVRAQHAQVVTALEAKFPAAAAHLDDAREDILAFTAFPREIWRQVWSNNPQERLNKEIRRRTDVVGIFPGRDAIIRLVGAVLAEQNDEWTEARRYMGPEILASCRKPEKEKETSTAAALAALTCGERWLGRAGHKGQPPIDHVFVQTTRPKAAAAVRIGTRLALRKRAELLELLRPCLARTEPWLQAGKYTAAAMSELPQLNGWSIAGYAGDRTPDKTQRLLNHAVWVTFAVMGVVRRFGSARLRAGRRTVLLRRAPYGGRGPGIRWPLSTRKRSSVSSCLCQTNCPSTLTRMTL
jgi:putative transposase